MKVTNLKAMMAKAITAGALAGAVFMAAPTKAEAQVSFGVRFGRPVYVAPRPVYVVPPVYGYGFGYDRFAYDRHLAWERHERFEHERFGWRR